MAELGFNEYKVVNIGDVVNGTEQTFTSGSGWQTYSYNINLSKGTYIAYASLLSSSTSAGTAILRLYNSAISTGNVFTLYSTMFSYQSLNGNLPIKISSDISSINFQLNINVSAAGFRLTIDFLRIA